MHSIRMAISSVFLGALALPIVATTVATFAMVSAPTVRF